MSLAGLKMVAALRNTCLQHVPFVAQPLLAAPERLTQNIQLGLDLERFS